MKMIMIIACLLTGIALPSCEKQDLEVQTVSSPGEGTVSVRSDDEPIIMRGHVKNTSGQAIASASVTLTASGQSSPAYSTTTDSYGAYYFGSVAQGSYNLKLSASGYVTKNIGLNANVNITRTDTLLME